MENKQLTNRREIEMESVLQRYRDQDNFDQENTLIIEFQPTLVLASNPPQWWVYYKQPDERVFNKISMTYDILKLFLETYGYATNDRAALLRLGIDINKHKQL